ncbi:MAG: transposase [Eubacteriales bacterium]|nr:transposase [Eubacteriales bacterium]
MRRLRYKIFAYCLMNNHVHILIKEGQEPLSLVLKRISSSYVYYYNRKYGRCGHLFQERFKSEKVENDGYFLTVLRYIHVNPLKAHIIKNFEEYKWSSYNEYVDGGKIVDIDFALGIFSVDKTIAIQRFNSFSNEENEDKCLEYDESKRIDDVEAIKIIKNIAGVKNINEIQGFEKEKRDEIIKKIKSINGLSIRQIARITGFSYNLVLKI